MGLGTCLDEAFPKLNPFRRAVPPRPSPPRPSSPGLVFGEKSVAENPPWGVCYLACSMVVLCCQAVFCRSRLISEPPFCT